MADTSYLARVIYMEVSNGTDIHSVTWPGSYSLMGRAKSIPAPLGAPNLVESTTLEDDTQTFELGVKQSDLKEFTCNLEKDALTAIDALEGKYLKIIQLYGTDGLGKTAKYAYVGKVTAAPNDVGGVDEILEMGVRIVPATTPKNVTTSLTVTRTSSGGFTVAAGSGS